MLSDVWNRETSSRCHWMNVEEHVIVVFDSIPNEVGTQIK